MKIFNSKILFRMLSSPTLVDVLVDDVLDVDDPDTDTGVSVPPVQVSVHSPLPLQEGVKLSQDPLHTASPPQLISQAPLLLLDAGESKEENWILLMMKFTYLMDN